MYLMVIDTLNKLRALPLLQIVKFFYKAIFED